MGAPGKEKPEKHFRRGLSTGFSQRIKGKRCEVCGFSGFPWQSQCPNGHPLVAGDPEVDDGEA